MLKHGPGQLRQLGILYASGAVFVTQFLAWKGMVNANFPGFANEGTLWFADLTIADPMLALPMISAITMHFVFKAIARLYPHSLIEQCFQSGSEGVSADMVSPKIRLLILYGAPVLVFAFTMHFASVRVLNDSLTLTDMRNNG
jgi:hypothetical protein